MDPAISPAAISRPAYCAWKAAEAGTATGPLSIGGVLTVSSTSLLGVATAVSASYGVIGSDPACEEQVELADRIRRKVSYVWTRAALDLRSSARSLSCSTATRFQWLAEKISFTAPPSSMPLPTVTARRRPRPSIHSMVNRKCLVNKEKSRTHLITPPTRVPPCTEEPVRPHTPCARLHVALAPIACRRGLPRVGRRGDREQPARNASGLHMSELAERFHPAAFILRPSASFSACRGPQLRDVLLNG